MPKKYREVRRALREASWVHVRTTGAHEQWRSPDGRSVVTWPAATARMFL